ncbi:MAG: cell division protein SepF [Candidatus Bathyarchaeia archaeon]
MEPSNPSEAPSTAEKIQGEVVSPPRITYLKALPLRDLSDVALIKEEVEAGNILIVRIAPLAMKSVEDVKKAINELREYIASIHGDIARLGEERIVLTPASIRIWKGREKSIS